MRLCRWPLILGVLGGALVACGALPADGLLRNGAFRTAADGALDGWQLLGDARCVPQGGPRGLPAVEVTSTGSGMNAALQVIRCDPPRRGPFRVTGWVRLESPMTGGDRGLWLDVLQQDGPPMWGEQGLIDAAKTDWQQVSVEVHPTHRVREIQIYCIVRGVPGRMRFADLRLEPIPVHVRQVRAVQEPDGLVRVQAQLSSDAPWTLELLRHRQPVNRLQGDGVELAATFADAASAQRLRLSTPDAQMEIPIVRAAQVDCWSESPLIRVFRDTLPPARSKRQMGAHLVRNDTESTQLCVRSSRPLAASVRVDPVRDATGRPAEGVSCRWSRVGYVRVNTPQAHPFGERRTAAWWPDPLLKPAELHLEAGATQPLWFDWHVSRNTPPGTYRSAVHLQWPDGALRVPVVLQVYRPVLPDRLWVKTAFALMDGHLKKVYGEITPALRNAYTDFLLEHRLNPDDISRTQTPDLPTLLRARDRGLSCFTVLNAVPEPTGDPLWVCYAEASAYTPEFTRRFLERLDEVVPTLRQHGLLDRACVYGFDERGDEYLPIIRDLFGAIKQRFPDLRTFSTCWPPAGTDPLSLHIDWFVQLSSSYDHQMAQHVRARGGEVWWYVCMGPNYPYANWLLENPLIESRIIWWQMFQHDVEGMLYWGLNIWERDRNEQPIADASGPLLDWSNTTRGLDWLNGDGVLLYPGEHGPLGSVRLSAIRDGLEDHELLRMYRSQRGALAADRLRARITTDRTHYTRDIETYTRVRRDLLNALR